MEVAMESVLVVADWTVDPHAVVAACSRRRELGDASFALLVPAVLHGLDWAGDPAASVPCATRQLEQVSELCHAAGLPVHSGEVGDPDPVTAIGDVVLSQAVDELVVCVRERPAHPFDLSHRVMRATGLPTRRVAVPGPRRRRTRAWTRIRRGQCATTAA
jgi:hypothetical protein